MILKLITLFLTSLLSSRFVQLIVFIAPPIGYMIDIIKNLISLELFFSKLVLPLLLVKNTTIYPCSQETDK